ncbi:unnamed protein product [Cylindrotheca closterium]|uniref:Uncharacterized protein n=1 Tax=Cylindrotheca closterium TaxID=2856 RepID=A0AAD2CAU7_9STRA|nr:unnamed protein product [Cylindrotheca closterium]
MKVSFSGNIIAILLMTQSVGASFFRDVAGDQPSREDMIENALLDKAVPLKEYRAKLRANGMDIADSTRRKLNENNNNGNNANDATGDDWYLYGNGDDWYRYGNGNENNYGNNAANDNYANNNNNNNNNAYGNYNNANNGQNNNGDDYYVMYGRNFNSYALKYSQCQPVQRFSAEAVQAGEASPMLVDDIVILRLCPTKSCSTTRKYGCSSSFAEYAVGLTDYVEIMLYYRQDRMNQMCDWCNICYTQRRLDENNNNNNNNGDDNAGDDYSWNGYNRYNYDHDCTDYKSYCYDSDTGYSVCEAYSANDDIKTAKYLSCVGVQDSNNNNYYTRPRCDGENQVIHMGVYYDNFCSSYAGDEVGIDDLNLGLQNTNFDEFYEDVNCLDCTKGEDPPNFLATHSLCSRLHSGGAACTERLDDYYLTQGDSSDSQSCKYIQSMRDGNYDIKDGQIYQGSKGLTVPEVTDEEKIWLVASVMVMVLLGAAATYLHSSITDIQVESMAHSELLPTKVHKIRNQRKSRSRSRGKR